MEPLLDLALLLFGAKVGGIIFSKLKQPSVVGELVAGIILGPSLLAIIRPSSLVTTVGDLGLLFLILLVSMSVDWKTLEGSTEKYIWIEIVRIVITIAMAYAVGSYLGWDIYTLAVVGLVMALSSTAIVSRTLADMKKLSTPEGNTVMGLEIVDEVVAIVSVAVLANLVSGAGVTFEPILTTILVVIGFFVVMGRIGFKLINRLTSSIQKYGIQEALFAFTLLLAFILGSITQSLNLAAILGVFIAGMILSRSAQHPIISRKVKDIGESFFIPVFFASVGLTINLMVALEQPLLILWLIIAIVVVKIAATIVTLKLFDYSMTESIKISSGFITLSEMTVVILALAVTKLSPAMYIGIIAAFVIVNVISPMIISFLFGKDSIKIQKKQKKWKAQANKYKYTYHNYRIK